MDNRQNLAQLLGSLIIIRRDDKMLDPLRGDVAAPHILQRPRFSDNNPAGFDRENICCMAANILLQFFRQIHRNNPAPGNPP